MSVVDIESIARDNVDVRSQVRNMVEVSQAIGGSKASAGIPFVAAKNNTVTFYMYILKQIERITLITNKGQVKFSITFDEFDDYHLAYSANSPADIAGQEIESDARLKYDDDYIFGSLTLTFPSDYTISGAFLDDADANILNQGDAWRLADIANYAAAAKTAAQAITGYALQGSDATATNTAIAALIGYTIQEIDGV